MSDRDTILGATVVVVEEQVELTFTELCRACGAGEEHVRAWIAEGVLEPAGELPADWRFTGNALRRARLARHLARDLEINAAGVALALDLLEEIEGLRARLEPHPGP